MALRAEFEPVADHGGSLDFARRQFPAAPEPWIDLSTGINPHAYPQPELPQDVFRRLPEPARLVRLRETAARSYGAPAAANVVAAPGTQILLPRVAALVRPGRALVLGPTYAEHIRAVAIAGHRASYASDFDALFDADLAILVNPNNPDGRLATRARLLELAAYLRGKGGLLVVDEAFMDVGPLDESLAGDVDTGGVAVLKSFGKFFGLAGVRLGFALAARETADRLNDELGPWAVAGPALACGLVGLADHAWQETMRARLAAEAAALDTLLSAAGLPVEGGTSLFRFVQTPRAGAVFETLGQAGILVRRFDALQHALRFGLPSGEEDWQRLTVALQQIRRSETRPGGNEPGVAAE